MLRKINLRKLENNFSLPSGDSAQAALWALLAAYTSHSLLPLVIVPLTMLGRVFYAAHFIGDTLVGAAIGFAWAHAIHFALPLMMGCAAGSPGILASLTLPPVIAGWIASACAAN